MLSKGNINLYKLTICEKSQVAIDWVDFVQLDGIYYLSNDYTLDANSLGPVKRKNNYESPLVQTG